MDLVRDVLDKLVVDRDGREMGRVDGLVLDQHDGEPPRLSALLIGPSVLAHRVHPALGRWVEAFERALRLDGGRPVRIAFRDVTYIDGEVELRLSEDATAVNAVEHWLRRWISMIPEIR